MPATSFLTERILDAAEGVLRRYGVAKTNVVDIARALGMSHANIYRYFPNKKALLDAVAARWLHAITNPLEGIVADQTRPAGERLAAWFDRLRTAKRGKMLADPELFRVYHTITEGAHRVVGAHVAKLLAQVECILEDGIAAGEFRSDLKPAAAARAFLLATAPFHHPALVVQDPATEDDAREVLQLLLAGLTAARPSPAADPGPTARG